jgi:hypothetical protein
MLAHTASLELYNLIEAIPSSTMPSFAEHGPLRPPPTIGDDDCKSLDTIKAVLQDHALINRYAINVDCSIAVKAAWTCSKSSKYRDTKNEDVLEKKR